MIRSLLKAVTTWEWLLLLLLVPLFLVRPTVGAIALLILPIFWIIRRIVSGYFFPDTPYNISLLVLALSIAISLTAVFSFSLSLPKISGLVFGIALFFAAVEHCRQRENGLWTVLAVVLLVGTAVALIAIPFSRWPDSVRFLNVPGRFLPQNLAQMPGAVDGVVNPNELAGVMTWIIPLLAAAVFGYGKRLWQSGRWYARLLVIFLFICLLITMLVLLATGSRGGMAGVILALLLMLAIAYPWGRWLLLAGVIVLLILVFSMGLDTVLTSPADAAENLLIQARVEIWSRAIEAIEDFPLTGLSMNAFRMLVLVYYPLTHVPATMDIGHAHNHLLQAGLDLGIIGLIAYLAVWFLSAGLLWKGLRIQQPQSTIYRPLLIGLAGSLTAAWLFGILDAIALGAKPGFIWWLLIALVAVSTSVAYRPVKEELEISSAV